MKRLQRALSLLFLAALALAARAAPPSAETLFAEPLFGGATLSPDGRKVAMLIRAPGQRTRLTVLDLNTLKPEVVAGFDDQDVQRAEWVNDERLVFEMRVELGGPGFARIGSGLYGVNADGSGFRHLVQAEGQPFVRTPDAPELQHWATHLRHRPLVAGSPDVIVARPEDLGRHRVGNFTLQRMNTQSGRVEELETPKQSVAWVFGAKGLPRVAFTDKAGRGALHMRQDDGTWKLLAEFDPLEGSAVLPRWVGPDGRIYGTATHRGRAAVFLLDAATLKPQGAPMAASNVFDIHPEFIADEQRLLGLRYTIDAEVTQWLDPAAQALQTRVDALLPATANRLQLPRRGESPWVLVQAVSDVQPEATYLFHRGTGKLSLVGRRQPPIDAKTLGQTDFVRFKARDGLDIPAWLTLPPGGGKALPLVVLVHGGPWVRGRAWGWSPEVQFLASRGYAVLEPEFRGSTGFGRKHFEAGWKQWGRAMQDDVADAARWAVAQGHADAKRICIAGASYGGYAVLMGLARDAELFRCGVAWVGVTDIQLLYSVGWSDTTDELKRFGLPRLVGDPVADAALLKAASPLENAARIRQPLLMAYGEWDVRVPPVHGEKFRDAVKPHNAQLDYVVYPKEGHGWQQPATNIDFWTRVERFLARNLPPP